MLPLTPINSILNLLPFTFTDQSCIELWVHDTKKAAWDVGWMQTMSRDCGKYAESVVFFVSSKSSSASFPPEQLCSDNSLANPVAQYITMVDARQFQVKIQFGHLDWKSVKFQWAHIWTQAKEKRWLFFFKKKNDFTQFWSIKYRIIDPISLWMVKRNYKARASKIFLERICLERSCGKNGGSRYQISKTKRSHTVQVGIVGNKKKGWFSCSCVHLWWDWE